MDCDRRYCAGDKRINITFALLQSRLLVMAQQEKHLKAQIGTLNSMFGLKLIYRTALDAEKCGHDDAYVQRDSMRVSTAYLVFLIEEQESSARDCFQSLGTDGKEALLKGVFVYAEKPVVGVQVVRAKHNDIAYLGNRTRLLFYLVN